MTVVNTDAVPSMTVADDDPSSCCSECHSISVRDLGLILAAASIKVDSVEFEISEDSSA